MVTREHIFSFLLQALCWECQATSSLAPKSCGVAMSWWQSLLKPLDLEWKLLPPINTAKPCQIISHMRHPLFFYLIISVTLQYATFSIQSLCVGGCEYFLLIVLNALAQAVAAERCFQTPARTRFSPYPSASATSCASRACHGETTGRDRTVLRRP